MKSRFVPYKIAKEAEKLGYKAVDCFGFYAYREGLLGPEYLAWGKHEWDTCGNTGHWVMIDQEAPLWQDLVDWLREEHQLEVGSQKEYGESTFNAVIFNNEDDNLLEEVKEAEELNSYYNAFEFAISAALEKIKKEV